MLGAGAQLRGGLADGKPGGDDQAGDGVQIDIGGIGSGQVQQAQQPAGGDQVSGSLMPAWRSRAAASSWSASRRPVVRVSVKAR